MIALESCRGCYDDHYNLPGNSGRAFWIKRWRTAIARLESDAAELSVAVAALLVEQAEHSSRKSEVT